MYPVKCGIRQEVGERLAGEGPSNTSGRAPAVENDIGPVLDVLGRLPPWCVVPDPHFEVSAPLNDPRQDSRIDPL